MTTYNCKSAYKVYFNNRLLLDHLIVINAQWRVNLIKRCMAAYLYSYPLRFALRFAMDFEIKGWIDYFGMYLQTEIC